MIALKTIKKITSISPSEDHETGKNIADSWGKAPAYDDNNSLALASHTCIYFEDVSSYIAVKETSI